MWAVGTAYRWPGMHAQVADVVRTCKACSRAKAAAVLKNPTLHPLPLVQYFHRLSLDLAGPFQASSNGSLYVQIITEHLSRAMWLRALPNKEAASVARVMRVFFGDYGAVGELVSDNGPEFQGVMAKLLDGRKP